MKDMKRSIFFILYTLLFGHAVAQVNYQVVPLPKSIQLTKEQPFQLDSTCIIVCADADAQMQRNAQFLKAYIYETTDLSLAVADKAPKRGKVIRLQVTPPSKGQEWASNAEGYRITISPKRGVLIEGGSPRGVFYGVQTLRKSLAALPLGDVRRRFACEALGRARPLVACYRRDARRTLARQECSARPWSLSCAPWVLRRFAEVSQRTFPFPAAVITDEPRFSYRAMHLDVCRHFFSVEQVKEYIDILALHNMNTFHWHLTDDQGWRIESKKYPRLHQIGSQRRHTVIGRNAGLFDETPHGGYYTQEQLREVVRYAAERCITVIPEVELPGHALAILAAYPELGCTGGPYEVEPTWGVFNDILCAGNDKAFELLCGVIDELVEIFPSKYINIGGDEAPKKRWEQCPKCQQRIREQGIKGDGNLTAEAKLQGYFTNRMEKHINSLGRSIIGWDEIMEGDISQSATVLCWRGIEHGIRAAQEGHDVIMAPTAYCYFDYYSSPKTNTGRNPSSLAAMCPWKRYIATSLFPIVSTTSPVATSSACRPTSGRST